MRGSRFGVASRFSVLGFPFLALLLLGLARGPNPPALPKDTLPKELDLAIPRGLPEARKDPSDNPTTPERAALGRKLFFDPKLSKDGSIACASCHQPDHGFASKEARAVGIRGQVGRRNAPSLFNRGWGTVQFWDGRAATLEEQALKPIEDPVEMDHSVDAVVAMLRKDESYSAAFGKAFKDGVTRDNLAKAIAAFERTLQHADTVYDAFIATDVGQLSADAKHGLWLFESKGGCWRCHSGPNFSDEQYHNTGVSWGGAPKDLGRHEITKKEGDQGRFKTPTLRGVALTPPYMHDGSVPTLEEVIKLYNKGGNANPHLDSAIKPLELSDEEQKDLVAFLKALSEKAK